MTMTRDRRWRLLPVFLAFVMLTGRDVTCLVCPSLDACDPATQCEEPVGCKGGVVKDVCQCCDTCAKVRGEDCGGPHGLRGRCDLGLVCVTLHGATHAAPTGDEDGVCLEPESACSSLQRFVGCNEVDGNCLCQEALSCTDPHFEFASREDCYRSVALGLFQQTELPDHCHNASCDNILPSCPVDSMPRYGAVPAGKCCAGPGSCLCDPFRCQVPRCDAASHELVLRRKATGRPGECCDIYECVYAGANCSLVKCPSHDDFRCPVDSYTLPSVLSPDGCCFRPQGCACLPTPCPPAHCPPGERLQILQDGDGTPDRCCTKFHCIKEGEPTCQYNGIEYVEGDTWKVNKCTSCTCKGNVTSCSSVQCNVTSHCKRMEVPEGECCEVCTGCMSSSGAAYDNGETWQENDCTTCSCIEGVARCQAELCAVQCTNPRMVSGQCCPHCDEPLTVTTPPECPSLDDCPHVCVNGHRKDANGCFICDCRLDGCDLQCDYGYVTDDDSSALCKCHCLTLDDCEKTCIHGFKMDASGCPTCKCAKCRSHKCAKKCPYGYVRNDRACRTCKCLNGTDREVETTDAHFYNLTTEVTEVDGATIAPPADGSCNTGAAWRDEGEMWHDGCRNCYCHASKEMCGLIHCPKPDCEHPVFFAGACCPNCFESDPHLPSANVTVCHSVDHTYRVEGETWELDACTSCICHGGQVLCRGKECPPAACPNPTPRADGCCFECPEFSTNSSVACLASPEGPSYASGATWHVDDCLSCRCVGGETECFSTRCPPLDCAAAAVSLKGKCCPQCLSGDRRSPLCLRNSVQYVSGETWTEGDCTECVCLDGGLTRCHEKTCSDACRGPVAVELPARCCSSCSDFSSPATPTSPHVDSGTVSVVPTTTSTDVYVKSMDPVVIGLSMAVVVLVMILFMILLLVCCRRTSRKKFYLPKGNTKVGDRNDASPIYNALNGVDLNNKTYATPVATTNSKYKPVNDV